MRKTPLFVLLLGLGAAAAAVIVDARTGQAPAPPPGASTPLTGDDGRPTTLAALHGSWVTLFFGYRSCPDVCPTSLAYMASELPKLGAAAARVKGVFVSIDPDDKPAELRAFVRGFAPGFVGLTGAPAAVQRLASALGAYYEPAKDAQAKGAAPRFEHTGTIHVLAPDGAQVDALSPPFAPGELAAKLKTLMGGQAASH